MTNKFPLFFQYGLYNSIRARSDLSWNSLTIGNSAGA